MSQFVDQVTVNVTSGAGGNGIIAWRREKYEPMGGPAGGSGGRGGSVYLVAHKDLMTLLDFRYKTSFEAEPGAKGRPKNMHGKDGKDLEIKVPIGTVVYDAGTHVAIADLSKAGDKVLVAAGGRGGRGNTELATPSQRAPYHCEPGEPAIERTLELELKLVADVGIAGLPNAGKSSLLAQITAARPKIANYPFSTLSPNLGVVKKPDGDGYVLADIPGLVEGAHLGVGLGHKFLRHIERTRLLVHLADISSETLLADIGTINNELHLHSPLLDSLPQLIVLNKCDLVDDETRDEIVTTVKAKLGELSPGSKSEPELLLISCATNYGVEALKNRLLEKLSTLEVPQAVVVVEPDLKSSERLDNGFKVWRKKNVFYVEGDRLERILTVTDLRSPESIHHFHRVLRGMGVIEALIKEGVQPGADVMIGQVKFCYGENLM